MATPSFTRNFLLIFSGPIIWALHFVAIYGWNGYLCARPGLDAEWLGMDLVTLGVVGASIVAVVAIIAIGLGMRPASAAQENDRFVRWLALALGALSVLAVVWETVPVFILPRC